MKRALCLTLALLFIAFSGGSVYASVLDDNENYRIGKYYEALRSVVLTGNMRTDIANVALSQVGYHEGKSEGDISGNSTGKNNFTLYGQVFGIPGDSWCANFVWWCARQAGIGASVIAKTEWAKPLCYGCRTLPFAECNDIQPGDLVFFDYNDSDSIPDHVGIIVAVDDSTITTVEGNSSNAVRSHVYKRGSGKASDGSGPIFSIGFPDYERGNYAAEYRTQFVYAKEELKTYSGISGKASGTLAAGEYLLLGQRDVGGERWYQVAYGLKYHFIKAGNTEIVTKNSPPITGCDWLATPDIDFASVTETTTETTTTQTEPPEPTTESTQPTAEVTTEPAAVTAEATGAVSTTSPTTAVTTPSSRPAEPEYESYFEADWLKYALYALLGVLLISIIIIIASGIKVHNDNQ